MLDVSTRRNSLTLLRTQRRSKGDKDFRCLLDHFSQQNLKIYYYQPNIASRSTRRDVLSDRYVHLFLGADEYVRGVKLTREYGFGTDQALQ